MANEQNPTNYIEERRMLLHGILCGFLGNDNERVQCQPPESFKFNNYPAIIYGLEDIDISNADNVIYNRKLRWRIRVIDSDPASEIANKISVMDPSVRFVRMYSKEELNYFVYTISF